MYRQVSSGSLSIFSKRPSGARMNVAFEFDSAESYEIFTYETAGPLHSMLVNETEEGRKEILEALTESTIKYVGEVLEM